MCVCTIFAFTAAAGVTGVCCHTNHLDHAASDVCKCGAQGRNRCCSRCVSRGRTQLSHLRLAHQCQWSVCTFFAFTAAAGVTAVCCHTNHLDHAASDVCKFGAQGRNA